MIRGIGIGCFAVFCVLTGVQRYVQCQRYFRILLELERFLLRMKSEIAYSKSSMPEFFLAACDLEYSGIGSWIREIAGNLTEEEAESKRKEENTGDTGRKRRKRQTFARIWQEAAERELKAEIGNPEIFHGFYRLGDEIGGMDMQSQLKYLELFLRDLEREISQVREQLPVRRRLYLSLGVMAGMFVTVLLI